MNGDFDDLLKDAARSYNEPPVAPREKMWESISRARSEAAVRPISTAWGPRRLVAYAAGIAAVLVVGIAIGRVTRPSAPASTVASRPITTIAPSAPEEPGATPAETSNAVERAPAPEGVSPVPRRLASATRPPLLRRGLRGTSPLADATGDDDAYRLALVEHLTRTELLLTGFRAQARSGGDARVDAQFASLSKELLGTTRMMLASHRGDDPVLTRLLQDLELVLMQLSQYAAGGRRVDLDAAAQSIEKRNVIPKLRSTIPAGMAGAGT